MSKKYKGFKGSGMNKERVSKLSKQTRRELHKIFLEYFMRGGKGNA